MENTRLTMACYKLSRPRKTSGAAFILATATLLASPQAQAETGTPKAKTGAKGTVGLALLGAETVLSVEALIGVKPWWGYAIGGGLGAIAGGVGGYFIDRMDKPAVSMGLLAGGLTLAIPTTIGLLAATAYKPPKNPEIDTAGSTIRAGKDLVMMQDLVARHALAHEPIQSGVVNLSSEGRFALRMPELNIVPVYTARETQMTRLASLEEGPNPASFRSVVLNLSF